jgi:vacuolar-type H+-ATPase subunit H
LDVSEYEAMVDKIEVLEDIKLAETQINSGLEISHQNVKKRFPKRL